MGEYTISLGGKQFTKDEVIEFLAKIYGPNYFEARAAQAFIIENEPSIRPENFIFAHSSQGKLIGMVRIVERMLSLGAVELKTGIVSSVAVLPDWRGKGVMSQLMDKSIAVMQSRGIELSVLYGRRAVDGLYPRFGYYGIGRYLDLEIISYPSFFPTHVPVLTVAVASQGDLGIMMQLYKEVYHSLAGSSIRDEQVWKFLVNRTVSLNETTRIWMCKEENENDWNGYVVFLGDTLVEAALPPQLFSAIPALLKTHDIKHVALHPRHPLFCFLRTHCNTILKERFALDGGYMGRIIDFEAVLKKMSATLILRAKQIGVCDECVRLFSYAVNLSNGEIQKTDQPKDIEFDNEATAVLMILGIIRLEDIPGIHITAAKPWLRYLFPETGFHTSAWDEV